MYQFIVLGLPRMSGGVKFPGDSFGATLQFQYLGPVTTVWVGIGLAYGELVGHNAPFSFAMKQVSVGPCAIFTPYTVEASGTLPTTTQLGKLLDVQYFISKTQPVAGQVAPDDFGVNDWLEEQYSTEPSKFQNLTVVSLR